MTCIKIVLFTAMMLCFGACKQQVLERIPTNEIISLEVSSDTTAMKADGQRLVRLRAKIAKEAKESYRTVTFLASVGLGQFQGTSTGTTQTVKVDENGQAEAVIKVSNQPGSYYVTAQIKEGEKVLYSSKEVAITLSPISATQKLILTSDIAQPPADNTTTVLLSVIQQFGSDKTIKLTTDQGFFINSSNAKEITLNLDDVGKASTLYRVSNRVVNHVIQGVLPSGVSTTLVLQPIPSLPDKLIAETSGSTVDTAGGSIDLTVYLRRQNSGEQVSLNTAATFTAFQVVSGVEQSVGRFTGTAQAVSDAQGKISGVKFFADTGNVLLGQPIRIRITAPKEGGQLVQEIVIQVKK